MGAGNVTYQSGDALFIPELIANMRELDRGELRATSDNPFHEQLDTSLRWSIAPGAAFSPKGELLCLFGAAPVNMLGDTAVPWLIGTKALSRYPRALKEGAAGYLGAIQQQYPRLYNYVDARNLPSIRWLKRMGFEIEAAEPFGYQSLPFHPFHKGY